MYKVILTSSLVLLITACAPTSYKPIQGAQLLMPLEQAKILCEAESEKKASNEISKRADELDKEIKESEAVDALNNASRPRDQDITMNCDTDLLGRTTCRGSAKDSGYQSSYDRDSRTTRLLKMNRSTLFIDKIKIRNSHLRECMAEKGYVGE